MSNYKITIEEINGEWVPRHGKELFQAVPTSMMSRKVFIKKMKQDHPNWLITNEIEPIEVVEVVNTQTGAIEDMIKNPNEIRPHEVELDIIEEAQAMEFNEPKVIIKQPVQVNPLTIKPIIKPVKEVKQEPVATAVAPEVGKRSFGGKVVSVTIGFPIYGLGTMTHLALETTGDVFHALARGSRNTEAFMVHKLCKPVKEIKHEDGNIERVYATREEIKSGVEVRTATIQGYGTLPFRSIKAAIAKRKDAPVVKPVLATS